MQTSLVTFAPSRVTAGQQLRRTLVAVAVITSTMLAGCNSSGKPTQNAQYQLDIGAAVSANAN